MKMLLFSDAHGSTWGMEEAMALHPDAKHILFLGDGVSDVENLSFCYPDRQFHLLSGNCDFESKYPLETTLRFEGITVFACHGHTLSVKSGLARVIQRAKLEKADVLVYGHTHMPYYRFEEGMHILNPGSVGKPITGSKKEYAIIGFTSKGIYVSLATV